MHHTYTNSEHAKSVMHFLLLVNIFIFFVTNDNFSTSSSFARQYLNLHRTYRMRDGITNIPSMILSIFYHTEPAHIFMNMISLYHYGVELFVHSSSRYNKSTCWHSIWVIFLSYLICGIGAFAGIELVSWFHEYQWEQTKKHARIANQCTHWLCHTINDLFGGGGGKVDIATYFTNTWSDFTTTIQYADVKLSMIHYQLVHRIGASGVLYGWMGMRLVTSWFSPYHSRLNGLDYFLLFGTLAHDLKKSPLLLDDLRLSLLLNGDGIDHSTHLMGTFVGILWALILIVWDEIVSFRFVRRNAEGGRRLGTRWEHEQNRHRY